MATNQISAVVSSAGQDSSAFIPTPRHPAQRVAPLMEISMSDNPNLHPVWAKQFGIESKAKPQVITPATVVDTLIGPVATQTSTRTTAAREETLSRAQIEAIFDDSG